MDAPIADFAFLPETQKHLIYFRYKLCRSSTESNIQSKKESRVKNTYPFLTLYVYIGYPLLLSVDLAALCPFLWIQQSLLSNMGARLSLSVNGWSEKSRKELEGENSSKKENDEAPATLNSQAMHMECAKDWRCRSNIYLTPIQHLLNGKMYCTTLLLHRVIPIGETLRLLLHPLSDIW
jgi:hypothetical protein